MPCQEDRDLPGPRPLVTGAGINTIPQRAGRLNAQRALHLSSAIRASLCMGPACDRCRLWRRGVSNGRVMTQAALYPVRSDSSNPPTLGLAPMTPSGITDVLHACPGSGQVTQALSRTCHICRDRNHVGLYTCSFFHRGNYLRHNCVS